MSGKTEKRIDTDCGKYFPVIRLVFLFAGKRRKSSAKGNLIEKRTVEID